MAVPSLPGIDRGEDAEALFDCLRGIEAQVLPVPRRSPGPPGEGRPDAYWDGNGGQSQGVDGHRHAHRADVRGDLAVIQIGASLPRDVGADRRDDRWVLLLELTPGPQQRQPVMKACSVATASGYAAASKKAATIGASQQARKPPAPVSHRPNAGGTVHDEQGIRRSIDPRRLKLIDDIASVLEALPRFADATLHLLRRSVTARVEHEGEPDGRGELGAT